ncbi:hypothetical protein AVEN_75181-1 [Araneus ventricosus]|uniref:Uncharacterized protein n=1 Tax=Araneus ventricosus TaxID=182803 RepID=A0A4Y2UWX1_ARAVE|nr:hypothetical protein AVEN_75181-1 [Araneus ventricosus]
MRPIFSLRQTVTPWGFPHILNFLSNRMIEEKGRIFWLHLFLCQSPNLWSSHTMSHKVRRQGQGVPERPCAVTHATLSKTLRHIRLARQESDITSLQAVVDFREHSSMEKAIDAMAIHFICLLNLFKPKLIYQRETNIIRIESHL